MTDTDPAPRRAGRRTGGDRIGDRTGARAAARAARRAERGAGPGADGPGADGAGADGPGAAEEGFRRAAGPRYSRLLADLHGRHVFDCYLEIGCRSGATFAPVRGRTIAVDPWFRVGQDIVGPKPALHVFQTTSDDFFAGGFLDRNGIALSLTFIDGMHLFEYALRDFIGAERHSRPGAFVLLHDCCPFSHRMTRRDLDNLPKGAWTGDVWKIIPVLKEYRPDLKVEVLDCAPTGLVAVSNLDPGNRVLETRMDGILARWRDLSLRDHGAARFYGGFDYVAGAGWLDRNRAAFEAIALDPATVTVPRRHST